MDGDKSNTFGMQVRPRTVGEAINDAIEQHNREIARLMTLRAECQAKGLLGLPQPLVSTAAHPDAPVW